MRAANLVMSGLGMAAIFAGALVASSTAEAQEESAGRYELQEIVVTGRRREAFVQFKYFFDNN